MNTSSRLRHLAALLILPAVLSAQTTAPAVPPPLPDEPLRLEDYQVTDQRDGYKGNTAITGTKTDTPLLHVPASIQVITREQIEDLGALDITDLYPLMGSVTEYSYGGVSFRGFRQEQTRYNGIAGSPYNEFGILALNNIEQVEVLKGPVGLLYGDNEPGGMINLVTARPRATFGGSLLARAGSNVLGGSASVTGPLDAGKRFLYLANLTYNETDGPRYNYHQQALNLTGALTWVISPATRLTGQIEHINNEARGARVRGVPVNAGGFVTTVKFNAAEPTDLQDLSTTVFNLTLDHAFSAQVRANAFYRYFESEAPQAYHEPNTYNAVTGIWAREFRHQLRNMYEESAAANLIADFDLPHARHKLLAGVEYSNAQRVFRTRTINQALVVPINVLNPVYGLSSGARYDISLAAITPNDTTKTRTGYYVQDQISVGQRWHFLAGARYEVFDDVRDRPTVDQFDDAVLTYRGGAVYMLRPEIAAYVSYAMGLKPQSIGAQTATQTFPPQESHSWESGLKFDLLQKRLSLTASVYQILKTNLIEENPLTGLDETIGEVTSQGFELDVSGQLSAKWSLTANYAYNDTKVTQGEDIGERFANAPRHKAGLWTRYNLPVRNLSLGAGLSYVGRRGDTSTTLFPGPAYTIGSLAVYYKLGPVQFSLKCDNVTDEVYSRSVFGSDGHFPGAPRSFTLTSIYRF